MMFEHPDGCLFAGVQVFFQNICSVEFNQYGFDFMRSDEVYKYRFGGVNSYVMRMNARKQVLG